MSRKNLKKTYKTIEELRDSYFLYDKKPPLFGYFILIIVLIGLFLAFGWSQNTYKTYIVEGNGTIISEEKNYIMSPYTGKVVSVYVNEGDFVSEGEELFRISSTDIDLQIQEINGIIEINMEKIKKLLELESCIKTGKNSFSENDASEKSYYYQYEMYMSQINQKNIDASVYQEYGYTDEQIDETVRTNTASVSELYYSTLKNITENIELLEREIDTLTLQIETLKSGQNNYSVRSETSGLVHMDTIIKEGMVVQASDVLGSIVSENNGYIADVYISATDMPLIHLGDQANIQILGLNQTMYGTLNGTVFYIASEPTINLEDRTNNFEIKIDLDNSYLISNQGNKVNISNGMQIKTRIIYDEVSYFYYILESLGTYVR